jgi:hypothetical protein
VNRALENSKICRVTDPHWGEAEGRGSVEIRKMRLHFLGHQEVIKRKVAALRAVLPLLQSESST